MTYNEFKSGAILRLSNVCENPTFEAECIIMHFSGFKRNELLLNRASVIPGDVLEKLNQAIDLRLQRHPLQYIIGEWEFFGLRMFCGQGCLIPRPETELLAEIAIKNLPRNGKLLDLCTGSGCVAISTLANTKGTTAIAADISEGALEVAKENAGFMGVSDRVEFRLCDVLKEPLCEKCFAVLSNPPYVSEECYLTLEKEIYKEPKIAFLGGKDGGDFYRALTPLYKNIIAEDGFIAYEIGYDQADIMVEIAKENGMSLGIIRDLGGRVRVAVLRRK